MAAPARRFTTLLAASLVALAPGCVPLSGPAPTSDFAAGGLMVLGQTGAILQGQVKGPSAGTAAYRALGTELVPMPGSIVYFTTPDERFYAAADGKPLAAFTDAEGRFALEGGPAEAAVFMTVLLSGNRRMVGFVRTVRGVNTADVDVATTYVAEFLRAQAAVMGRSLMSMPLGELETVVALTRELLAAGRLPVPSLDIAATPALRTAYVQAFGTGSQALSDAWTRVLGRRPLALEDLPLGLSGDQVTYAAESDASGSVYVIVANDSAVSLLRRRPTGQVETLIRDVSRADLDAPFGGFTFDRAGYLLWPCRDPDAVFRFQPDAPPDFEAGEAESIVDFSYDEYDVDPDGVAVADDGTVYVTDINQDRVLKVLGPEDYEVIVGGEQGFNGDQTMPAVDMQLSAPEGLTWARRDGRSMLYIADRANNRIREVDLEAGTARTVVGSGNEVVLDHLRGGFEGGPGSSDPLKARLYNPYKVAIDARGRMFIADSGNHLIRMLADGRLSILAGLAPGSEPRMQAGDALGARLGDVRSVALDPAGDLLIGDRQGGLRKLHLRFGS